MLAPLVLPLLLIQTSAQAPATLSDYLKGSPIPNSLTVASGTVERTGNRKGIEAYDRKVVRLGTIDAVVPKTIVSFDDTLSQPPNLYDGLPRESKVLYLLASLSPHQFSLAAGKGIGVDDLQGESRAVFVSLMPKVLKWQKYVAGKDASEKSPVSSGALEGAELRKVKLQIVRSLELFVRSKSSADSLTSISTRRDAGAPGEVVAVRQDDGGMDEPPADVLYGVRLRSIAENRLKAGGLDTKSLSTPLTLGKTTTVGGVLGLVGRATGKEILADMRIRDLAVDWNGGEARSGDVLDALALSVGGTYRKVGSAYLLTSDVMGAGTRQVRLRAWKASVRDLIARKKSELYKKLRDSGAGSRIGYAADDKLAPNSALLAVMSSPALNDGRHPVPNSSLTPELRAFIRREQLRQPHQEIADESLGGRDNVTFRFVLPDGTALRAEGEEVGLGESFDKTPEEATPVSKAPLVPPVALTADRPAPPVLFRTEDPGEASRAVSEAKAHGVREVWLETRNPKALSKALEGGVAVRLVLRPWSAPAGTPGVDLDRNLFGDDGQTLQKRLTTDPLFAPLERPEVAPRPIESILSPGTPSWANQIVRIGELARTPGLAGLVLMGTAPRGYEGARGTVSDADYPPQIAAVSAFGFTASARLSFVRRYGVDPIDLGWHQLRTIDLRPSYFPDEELSGERGGGPGRPQPEEFSKLLRTWDAALGAANTASLKELLAQMPPLPLDIEGRSAILNSPPVLFSVVIPHRPSDSLPVLPDGAPTGAPNERMLAPASVGGADDFAAYFIGRELGSNARGGVLPVVDLSAVLPSRWASSLDRTLVRTYARNGGS